jgi:hypothetical protein
MYLYSYFRYFFNRLIFYFPIDRSVKNKSTIGLLEALPGYLAETKIIKNLTLFQQWLLLRKNNRSSNRYQKILIHTLYNSSTLSINSCLFNLMCNFRTPDTICIINNMIYSIFFSKLWIYNNGIRSTRGKTTSCRDETEGFCEIELLELGLELGRVASYGIIFYLLL